MFWEDVQSLKLPLPLEHCGQRSLCPGISADPRGTGHDRLDFPPRLSHESSSCNTGISLWRQRSRNRPATHLSV